MKSFISILLVLFIYSCNNGYNNNASDNQTDSISLVKEKWAKMSEEAKESWWRMYKVTYLSKTHPNGLIPRITFSVDTFSRNDSMYIVTQHIDPINTTTLKYQYLKNENGMSSIVFSQENEVSPDFIFTSVPFSVDLFIDNFGTGEFIVQVLKKDSIIGQARFVAREN